MSDIITQIEALEKKTAAQIEAALKSPAIGKLQKSFVQALGALLNNFDPETIKKADLQKVVSGVLKDKAGVMSKGLQKEISTRLDALVTETLDFYDAQDTAIEKGTLSAAMAKASAAKTLRAAYGQSMNAINADLLKGTLDALDMSITKGLDRDTLQEDIQKKTDTFGSYVRTQTQAVISGYNQIARNEIAQTAGLEHFYYYGQLRHNSRPFCRVNINKTFTAEQRDQMDNGMLNPVSVYKGGWRCVHSWLAVRPEWLPDDASASLSSRAHTIKIGKGRIKVFTSKAGAARLTEQVGLQNAGYHLFYDALKNDKGYTAVHESWFNEYNRVKRNKNAWKIMDNELTIGRELSELGNKALFNLNEKNKAGGPVDIIFNGRPTDIKTPVSFTNRTLERQLDFKQSDHFIIALNKQIPDYERAVNKVKERLEYHPGATVYLFDRNNSTLEKLP